MERTKRSVEDFLASVENPTRRSDADELLAMMGDISGASPALWGPSIIGFGSAHYRYDSGREGDMPIISFSPRKSNLVLYLTYGVAADEELRSALGKHRVGKACLYINKLSDIDILTLRRMVERVWDEVTSTHPCTK